MAANGNGAILLGMAGGDLSVMLADISSLEFGNALLAKLGVPKNTQVQCMRVRARRAIAASCVAIRFPVRPAV